MRCYIEPKRWAAGRLVPSPDEAHHLLHVLRVEAGLQLEVFDGQGRTAPAEVIETGPAGPVLQVGPAHLEEKPVPEITLVQALPKTGKMEWIIQKGTELGMQVLVPIAARHSVVKLDGPRAAKKTERWRTVALQAVRQCSRAWTPEMVPVQKLGHWLDRGPLPDRLLFGDIDPRAVPLKEALRDAGTASPRRIGMVIGPEGDLDEEEKERLLDAGATPVGLGPTILRTETAALYALSVLRYEFF